jgi:hypothetical protein
VTCEPPYDADHIFMPLRLTQLKNPIRLRKPYAQILQLNFQLLQRTSVGYSGQKTEKMSILQGYTVTVDSWSSPVYADPRDTPRDRAKMDELAREYHDTHDPPQ